MQNISLSAFDIGIAAALVMAHATLTFAQQPGLAKQIIIASLRAGIQLTLIGLVLKFLFDNVNLWLMLLISCVMLITASHEVKARQEKSLRGHWGYTVGSGAMFVSSFSIAVFTLLVIINADPWYTPQYAIPLIGMMLGNTMNAIAISLDRLFSSCWKQKAIIEQKLLLGYTAHQAIEDIKHDSMRAGLIPIVNAMATAGLVNLPGMMTGQILAGSAPVEAVKYQILILFLIAAGTGFGVKLALWMASRRLFDQRLRLRLDMLNV